jgi:Subtilase family
MLKGTNDGYQENFCAGGGGKSTLGLAALVFCTLAQANEHPVWRSANGSYDAVDLNHANALKQIATMRAGAAIRLELLLNEPSSSGSEKSNTRSDMLLQLRQAFVNRYSVADMQNVVMANEIPLLSVDATAAGIDALLADPQVLGFSDPRYYQDLMLGVNTILQAPQLPAMRAFGQSQYSIGVIDSGVDYNHPGLSDRALLAGGCSSTSESGLPSICNTGGAGLPCSASTTYNLAMSGCGHGTHVAGIALGQFGNSAFNGLAPNLGLLSYQASSLGVVLGRTSRRYQNIDVQNALTWMITQARSKPGGKTLAAVNMSFGTQGDCPPSGADPTAPDRLIQNAIRALRAGNTTPAGLAFEPVLVVAAAGNSGKNSLGFPACLPEVVSVGASTRSDRQQVYSAVASDFGARIKLFAPGGTAIAFLDSGAFQFAPQDFISYENDWSPFTALIGAAGSGLTNVAGVNPQTVLSQQIPVDSMSLNPSGSSAGFARFGSQIAFRGSEQANAPYLLISTNASNRRNIRVQYTLSDIDSINNSQQAVALQYRTSILNNFINVPSAFVADATQVGTGTSNSVNVVLPTGADKQSFLQLRIITSNAAGTDEWVAIDQINVSSEPLLTAAEPLVFATCGITVANGVGSVCSAQRGSGFSMQEGTSMAAPQVTGTIARLRDRFPQLSVTQVEALLLTSGLPITAFTTNTNYVVPRLRPLEAFKIASTPRALTSSAVLSNCSSSQISWQIPEIMQATGYRYRTAVDFGALAGAAITQIPNTISQVINVPAGHILVQLLAFDSQGEGSWSDPVMIQRAPCAPAATVNLIADRIGTGPGHFCWGSVANATSYQMEDRPIGIAFSGQATVSGITELSNFGSLDWFDFPDVRAKVRACNNSGCGAWSVEAELRDRDIMSLPPPDYISPCSSF